MARREYKLPERLTDKQARSLRILRDHDVEYPAQFARLAWPDADGWRRSRRCGPHGVHRGGGMYVAAGCHLGILERQGLITSRYKDIARGHERAFRPSAEGLRLLDAHERAAVD